MTDTLDLDHLRQWIGRTDQATDIDTAQLVKRIKHGCFRLTNRKSQSRRYKRV